MVEVVKVEEVEKVPFEEMPELWLDVVVEVVVAIVHSPGSEGSLVLKLQLYWCFAFDALNVSVEGHVPSKEPL